MLYIVLSIGLLFSILLYRAYIVHQACQHDIESLNNHTRIKLTTDMLDTVKRGLQFTTVSYKQGDEDLDAKIKYVDFIRNKFNDLERHEFVSLNLINKHSLLYEIKGKVKSLKPYMLAAHFDVVPAESEQWEFHPFSGK